MALARYAKGGLVDESVPDLSAYRAHLPPGFEQWLARELGMYRLMTKGGRETKGDNVRALEEIIRRLGAVIEIDDQALPPSADALVTQAAYRGWGNEGVSALSTFRKLREEATRARAVCKSVLFEIEKTPAQTGRASNVRAERLLIQVTERLIGKTLSERLQKAVEILALCRVRTPDAGDDDSLTRIYRRARAAHPDLHPPPD